MFIYNLIGYNSIKFKIYRQAGNPVLETPQTSWLLTAEQLSSPLSMMLTLDALLSLHLTLTLNALLSLLLTLVAIVGSLPSPCLLDGSLTSISFTASLADPGFQTASDVIS